MEHGWKTLPVWSTNWVCPTCLEEIEISLDLSHLKGPVFHGFPPLSLTLHPLLQTKQATDKSALAPECTQAHTLRADAQPLRCYCLNINPMIISVAYPTADKFIGSIRPKQLSRSAHAAVWVCAEAVDMCLKESLFGDQRMYPASLICLGSKISVNN